MKTQIRKQIKIQPIEKPNVTIFALSSLRFVEASGQTWMRADEIRPSHFLAQTPVDFELFETLTTVDESLCTLTSHEQQ
jgi:hypothetical protein